MFNVLQRNAGQTAALDLGYKSFDKFDEAKKRNTRLLYLLGADETKLTKSDFDPETFIIYQGHHGDAGAEIADLILPGAVYTEKKSVWVNTEGRSQRAYPAVAPPGDARSDWKILRAISEIAAKQLPYDTTEEIRRRLVQIAPHFARYGDAEDASFLDLATKVAVVCFLSYVCRIQK